MIEAKNASTADLITFLEPELQANVASQQTPPVQQQGTPASSGEPVIERELK